jgi:tetratricopeptide (TPR) repeat protein
MDYRADMIILAHDEFKKIAGPQTDARWGTALLIASNGDLPGAARLVTELLKSIHVKPYSPDTRLEDYPELIDQIIYDVVIGTLANLASLRTKALPEITEMLCSAADAGYYQSAYNAANGLWEAAKTREDYKRAEHYFKIAINTIQDKSLKAASLVNYAELVRDGLITGKQDYPGAIAIYEQAADLGLVTGMFNAASVAMWEVSIGKKDLIEKAAYWFNRGIEMVDAKKSLPPMDHPETIKRAYAEALVQLADFHISEKIRGADVEFGLKLAQKIESANPDETAMKNWLLEVGLSKRITGLSHPAVMSASHSWHYLLENLGWKLGPVVENTPHPLVDSFQVQHRQGTATLVIIKAMISPHLDYSALDKLAASIMTAGSSHVFLVSQYGMFRMNGNRVHCPLLTYTGTGKNLVTFNITCSPDELIATAHKGLPFMKDNNGVGNCAFPIALNMLNSGRSISEGLDLGSLYQVIGGWCVPALDDLSELKFMQPD